LKGFAELDDVCEALNLSLDDEALDEYSTIGGYLLSRIGAIPSPGTVLKVSGYMFTVKEIEDNRRILSLVAHPIIDKAMQVNTGGGENAELEDKGDSVPDQAQSPLAQAAHDENAPNPPAAATADGSSPAPTPVLEPTLTFRDGQWVEVPGSASAGV
jgi:hypothetical protein